MDEIHQAARRERGRFWKGFREPESGAMFSLLRQLQKWSLRRADQELLSQIERKLTELSGQPVSLHGPFSKGGADKIYHAFHHAEKFAVVRVLSSHPLDLETDISRTPGTTGTNQADLEPPLEQEFRSPPQAEAPRIPLSSPLRLQREWDAYQSLFPLGLAPRPLWKNELFAACSWVDWERASHRLIRQRHDFWPLMEAIFPAIGSMHRSGITHLDLNPGNILVRPDGFEVMFIDFEYGPAAWMSPPQQQALDALRLVNECVRPRRGGKYLLNHLDRLVGLLQEHTTPAAQKAPLPFIQKCLPRIYNNQRLCDRLREVFHLL